MTTAVVPYQQLERMAATVAKSGLFAVKTPEAALTLMLIAQAENIHPAQAMTEYDLIQGKPALKASAMLSRFQKAGGKVKWIERTDAKVSAEFSHPAGGSVVITWDDARVKLAGLDSKEMHRKFPQQMKSARCISEGVRALFPGVSPANLYTPEEVADMEQPIQTVSGEQAVQSFSKPGLPQEQVDEAMASISAAADLDMLKRAYQAAYKAAREVGDEARMSSFKLAYDARKGELESVTASGEVI